jgi:predicted 3-demethylubiquinone-9 3-methyltransferase (glyoxalase superfamily)
MSTVTSFITYKSKAYEAAQLYVSLIRNSKITGSIPGPNGSFSMVFFELDGRPYTAMNGGESFSFSSGFSLFVEAQDQEEVDKIWNGLVADGGAEGPCGWLTDKFGLSWQVIPKRFMELAGHLDQAIAGKVFGAMRSMKKLIVADLEAAASS